MKDAAERTTGKNEEKDPAKLLRRFALLFSFLSSSSPLLHEVKQCALFLLIQAIASLSRTRGDTGRRHT